MKIAIVGSHKLTKKEEETASFIIDAIGAYFSIGMHVLISGGAEGIDTIAEQKAEKWGWIQPSIIYLPKNKRWAPDGYEARNIKIAQDCDMLICIRSNNSKTNGSKYTAQRAENMGKSVWRIYL